MAKVLGWPEKASLEELFAELSCVRGIDQELTTATGTGLKILPFIKGLRFSAKLINVLRTKLDGTNYTASWGHILDPKDQSFISVECDIIIHRRGGAAKTWNGSSNGSIMEFIFIPADQVCLVISCKSLISTSSVEKNYPDKLKPFVNKVWLFAETCKPGSLRGDKIQTRVKACGYEKFWYLYKWNKNPDLFKPSEEQWADFLETVRREVRSLS